ncbi:hypothetical protein A2125_00465 [Candidatus Woesebacteria bacterium GWB1_43_5]|uniref:RCK N-terminal domain-containing protein n=1 Tax=Candidatus Woesebacteria bacterium GWB1_43_5 TaxID=1802474 RepID=A0A1F7WSG2_9BACT|nr:MAG: hypothetical protein A2125_00465 [Candidatus Woesebacteria bacterium GWB1_43_5]
MEFTQISILLVAAAICASIARFFKQPTIVGYIFAGFLLATLGIGRNIEVFSGLGQVGVALLLFLVGVEMNLKELPSIGRVALFAGGGQMLFTSLTGFILALVLGFSPLVAIYIAIALTFSSTIVIIKLLSEKKDLQSLYGRISLGVLLAQDLIAVVIIMFLAGLRRSSFTPADFIFIAIKATFLIAATWVLSKKVMPRLFDKFLAQSTETLFIGGVAWALGVSAFVGGPMGFTLEIGGFLAGLALSNLPEHLQIASRTKPVRDFFLTIFFLLLGTHLQLDQISGVALPALVFSIFVIVGNPLILLSILGLMGHSRRTSFLAGLTMAQISEFSLILMTMGLALGHVGQKDISLVILVGVITMTISTYLIMGAEKIYLRVKDYLGVFERKKPKEDALNLPKELKNHIVLIGSDRTGRAIVSYLVKKNFDFVVVDFNPNVFATLTAEKVPVIFGDITDPDIFELSSIKEARLVISTNSDLTDNLTILENIKRHPKRPITMFTTVERSDGVKLYEKGADYVLVPQAIAGEHIRHILATYGTNEEKLKRLGKANFNRLMNR